MIDENIAKIKAGDDMSCILSRQDERNVPYTFGSGLNYRLGFIATFIDIWTTPRKVEQLEFMNTIDVISTAGYTLFVTEKEGEYTVFGVGTDLEEITEGCP